MRLAGTCNRYSKSAMPQLARATTYHADPSLKNFRWPYQATVMNTLEATRSRMVCSESGMAGELMRPLLVHADEWLVVADKPAGLLSVPGRGPGKADCLSARLQQAYPDARVVHRLDMATSGLFLMARGDEMQRRMGAAFA